MRENLIKAIQGQIWKKTEYIKPHEYFIFAWNPSLFLWLEQEIKENGLKEDFMGRSYTCWDFEGFKYWIIYPVCNRRKLE